MGLSRSVLQSWSLSALLQALGYAIPTTLVSVVGIVLAWRWRRRMKVASRRVIFAFALQFVSVINGLASRLYISSSYFRGFSSAWGRFGFLAALNALGLVLHLATLGMLLWAVHGAYGARGDVERFI
jgi:hypothetical protein